VRGRGGERAKEGKKNRNSEKLNTKKLENRNPDLYRGRPGTVLMNIRT